MAAPFCHIHPEDRPLPRRSQPDAHTMRTNNNTGSDITTSTSTTSLCYFSLPITSTHFSTETPGTTPLSAYSPDIHPDPYHPLLASRPLSPEHHMAPAEATSLLQLQTSAAHRPAAQPLQNAPSPSRGSSSPSSSGSSSNSGLASPSTLCCSRCRRESGGSMVQFGTNLYYCSHCARMTGYCAGG